MIMMNGYRCGIDDPERFREPFVLWLPFRSCWLEFDVEVVENVEVVIGDRLVLGVKRFPQG